jgi:hypothetical protein
MTCWSVDGCPGPPPPPSLCRLEFSETPLYPQPLVFASPAIHQLSAEATAAALAAKVRVKKTVERAAPLMRLATRLESAPGFVCTCVKGGVCGRSGTYVRPFDCAKCCYSAPLTAPCDCVPLCRHHCHPVLCSNCGSFSERGTRVPIPGGFPSVGLALSLPLSTTSRSQPHRTCVPHFVGCFPSPLFRVCRCGCCVRDASGMLRPT